MNWLDIQDRHRGQVGLVICNGPSLRKIPNSFLNKYPSIGTNGIFMLPFQPTYYVAINELTIRHFYTSIKIGVEGQKFIKNGYAKELNALPLISDFQDNSIFSKRPDYWIYEGGTVTHVALQLAYFMGFQTVLLVGLDHKYDYKGAPNQAVVAQEEDVNHFTKNYFPPGTTWNLPDLQQSEISYAEAKKVFEEDNRSIINLTPDSCELTFTKMSIRDWTLLEKLR